MKSDEICGNLTKRSYPVVFAVFKPVILISLYFKTGILKGECRPFFVDGKQVGLIRPDVVNKLLNYPEVFIMRESDLDGRVSCNCTQTMMSQGTKTDFSSIFLNKGIIELNPAFRDYNERTNKVEQVLLELRDKDEFITLRGWRNEVRISIFSLLQLS